jgi:hypothetical protein
MSPWSSSFTRPIRSTCLLSLALFGALACKPADETDADDDGDQPATPIEADDAAEVIAEQICAQLFSCECPNAVDYADQAACVAAESAEVASRIDSVIAAGGSWDPECAGQLAKAMSDWECLGQNMAMRESSYNPILCPALKGSLGVNGDCYRTPLGDDCQEGLTCLGGVCAVTPTLPVPVGQQCYYGDLPCATGSYCGWDQNFEMQICLALPDAGDSCVPDSGYCGPASNDLLCVEATCTPAPGEGESCELFQLCAPGLYCDGGKDFTCQLRQELGEGCGADAVCPVDASCLTNICTANPAAICNATGLF